MIDVVVNLYDMNQLEYGNYHFFFKKGGCSYELIGCTNYRTDYGIYVYSDIAESSHAIIIPINF